ncbi:hypothetical protein SSP531S_37910 [Streptomyces spongiicola]|uniref:Uncharacterized protein n=1 Tax=Streptomyces spongiicola TaxID=1690221 RepID=A0A2S1Z8M9_9ACTN|nr:DUF6381 family protein [Streptomyces spongiicola]AWK12248.1 hypothetical protein DDQ41_28775 [Streptomyces spongiicola]GBQ02332.1 hypothetical protein SSP531S_37910 [Streptomyces spongiicola]
MGTAREPARTPEELRLMADELTRGAERCKEPEHRARLHRRAEELRRQSDTGGIRGTGSAEERTPVHARQDTHRPRGARDRRAERPRGS